MRVLLVLLLGIGLAAAVAAPAAAGWRPPVGGPVVAPYAHVRGSFARGERRGVRFAARPGAVARAPCGGRVTWAGAVGSVGPGVAVRCGALSATVTGLASLSAKRGRVVRPGAVVGRAGAAGLGAARRAAARSARRLSRPAGPDGPRHGAGAAVLAAYAPPFAAARVARRRACPPARRCTRAGSRRRDR